MDGLLLVAGAGALAGADGAWAGAAGAAAGVAGAGAGLGVCPHAGNTLETAKEETIKTTYLKKCVIVPSRSLHPPHSKKRRQFSPMNQTALMGCTLYMGGVAPTKTNPNARHRNQPTYRRC